MENIISTVGLTRYYGGLPAISDVSVNLYGGRVTCLAGANGSGKTTFLRLAAGHAAPSGGSITVCGLHPGYETNELTAYLPDKDFLPADEKLIGIVRLYKTFYRDFDAEKAAELLNLMNADLTKRFGEFSRGMRANIQTALTAARRARLFLLDEPSLGCGGSVREKLLYTIFDRVNEDAAVVVAFPGLTREPEGSRIDDVLLLRSGTVLYCGAAADMPQDELMGL